MPHAVHRPVLALLVLVLVACGGSRDETTAAPATPIATSPSPAVTSVSGDAGPTTAVVATTEDATATADPATTASSEEAGVAGAELVCPAIAESLAVASEAGWGPGAAAEVPSAWAALQAPLLVAMFPDLPNDQIDVLWTASDSIAEARCPADRQLLLEISGAASIERLLRDPG